MYKKILTLSITILGLLSYTFSYQQDIPFQTYLEYTQAVSKFGSHLSPIQIEMAYNTVRDKICTRQEDENYFYLDPICLLHKIYPTLEFTQVVDLLHDSIQWFNHVYNTAPTETFNYEWWAPTYKDSTSRDFLLLQNTPAHKAIATFHSIEEDKIKIPKQTLAQIIAQDYTFYAVYNDTSMRRWCTLHNYKVGLQSMDKVLLHPWHTLNFNKHISGLDYCKGSGRTDLQFYAGVCGAASQLFRTSLIIPNIEITQRHAHSQRWWYYYGDEITWDDAAIYEMHKQFEIKNNDTRGIYFRTIQREWYDYLIAVVPYKSKQGVHITRQRESNLKTNITKNIYDIHDAGTIQTSGQFPSRYTKKNNTRN